MEWTSVSTLERRDSKPSMRVVRWASTLSMRAPRRDSIPPKRHETPPAEAAMVRHSAATAIMIPNIIGGLFGGLVGGDFG